MKVYIHNENFLNLEDLNSYFSAWVRSIKASRGDDRRGDGQPIAFCATEALYLHLSSKEKGKKWRRKTIPQVMDTHIWSHAKICVCSLDCSLISLSQCPQLQKGINSISQPAAVDH